MLVRQAIVVFIDSNTEYNAEAQAQLGKSIVDALDKKVIKKIVCQEVKAESWFSENDFEVCPLPQGTWTEQLGEVFEQAFASEGIERAVVVNDKFDEIAPETIEKALVTLESHSVVLGPTTNGGYYLFGLKTQQKSIFTNNHAANSQAIIDHLYNINERVYLLPRLG